MLWINVVGAILAALVQMFVKSPAQLPILQSDGLTIVPCRLNQRRLIACACESQTDLPIEQGMKIIDLEPDPDYPRMRPNGSAVKGIWSR